MLVRTSKDKQNPYVIINKSIFDDPNISLQAKGLIIFCRIKFAEGDEFSFAQLHRYVNEHQYDFFISVKQLIENKYFKLCDWRTKEICCHSKFKLNMEKYV